MSEERIRFLEDQVERLNRVLSKYQLQKDLNFSIDNDLPAAPWLTNQEYLTPLLKEYDETVEALSAELDAQKECIRNYKSHYEMLMHNHEKLQKETKAQITQELTHLEGSSAAEIGHSDQNSYMQNNLQHQLEEAIREKDAVFELWQTAQREIDRLDDEVQKIKSNPQYQVLEDQTEEIKRQYYASTSAMQQEIDQLKSANRQLRDELHSVSARTSQFDDTKISLHDRINEYKENEMELQRKLKETQSKFASLEKYCNSLKKELESVNRTATVENRERSEYEKRIQELTNKCSNFEQQLYQAVCQVKESVQMADEALIEKEQAEFREKQRAEDCERLQEAIDKLLDDAGNRTREEVESVKTQANNNLNRVIEELNVAESERSKKAAELERVVREKTKLENEIEKHYRQCKDQLKQESITLEETTKRALRSEREREDLRLQFDSYKAASDREANNWKNEKMQLKSEIEQLKERVASLSNSCDRALSESQKYAAQVEEAEQKVIHAKKETERAERKNIQQIALMEQAAKLKEQEFQATLQSKSDTHRHALAEMRQMLAMQQKVGNRWKEECHTIAGKLEEKVAQLKSDLERQKKRNEELTLLLSEAKCKISENDSTIDDYAKLVKRLEDRLKMAEKRTQIATQQSTKHLQREQKWLEFKKEQQSSLIDVLAKSNGYGSEKELDES